MVHGNLTLEHWHLCNRCWVLLELGFGRIKPGDALEAYCDGRGFRLSTVDVRVMVSKSIRALREDGSRGLRREPAEAGAFDPVDLEARMPRLAHSMTTQERAVLTISATGLAVPAVADALTLSPETVRTALRSGIAKLGARSKLEAIVFALRSGMIDPPHQHGAADGVRPFDS